jgi:hypothetical protein
VLSNPLFFNQWFSSSDDVKNSKALLFYECCFFYNLLGQRKVDQSVGAEKDLQRSLSNRERNK